MTGKEARAQATEKRRRVPSLVPSASVQPVEQQVIQRRACVRQKEVPDDPGRAGGGLSCSR
jgi:hypothetical protein